MANTSVDNYSIKGHEDIYEVIRKKLNDVSEESDVPILYGVA